VLKRKILHRITFFAAQIEKEMLQKCLERYWDIQFLFVSLLISEKEKAARRKDKEKDLYNPRRRTKK